MHLYRSQDIPLRVGSATRMDVRLILDSGSQKGRETSLSRGIYLVGRSRICQIRPKNRYVSRKHCAIIHRKREVLIQDLGSKTGTYINRVRIDPKTTTVLQDGDRIRVGKTKFRVTIVVSPTAQIVGMDDEAPDSDDSNAHDFSPVSDEGSDLNEEDAEHDGVTANSSRNVSDVLRMLEEDDEEDDADSPNHFAPGTEFQLSSKAADLEDDDDSDDSDGNVVFSAPQSGDSLGLTDPVPSYASRKDWDVKSVYSWIEQKETFARLDQRRAKRRAKEQIQNAEEVIEQAPEAIDAPEEKYTPQQREAQARLASSKATTAPAPNSWVERLDTDSMRPIVLVTVGVVFAAWIAWNAWLLISFKG
ncbi:MAG: FHA domain-containing protein [Pirellulaceae bacterium]|nr:FHA domain-containing protein [Pirellulaceae bacterium]